MALEGIDRESRMKQFLLVYDRKTGKITNLQEYDEGEHRRALEDRFNVEASTRNDDLEVVVLRADSLEALKQTHGRYFKTPRQLIEDASS